MKNLTSKCILLAGAVLSLTSMQALAQVWTTQTYSVTEFGGWPRTQGDTNMDTNHHDAVPASLGSNISTDGSKVYLDLHFYCKEYRGDGTTFEGDRRLVVFTAPFGRRILDLRIAGPAARTFNRVTYGQNWELNEFATPIRGSYWTELKYRIDSREFDDSPYIGVAGKIQFDVQLSGSAPFKANSKRRSLFW